MRLFCLPFAGGGSAIFHAWRAHLSADIELAKIQLPGRETRLREKAYTRMAALIEALTQALLPWLDRPFAFFGHSMGALIAFELSRALRRQHGMSPCHIFVSGFRAPQLPPPEEVTGLPDAHFIERMRQYGGIPELVFQDPELLEIFLPILRADFELLDTYAYQPEEPLDCPLTAFGGDHDPKVSADKILAWQTQTAGEFTSHILPGGHFFINESQAQLLEHLHHDITRALDAQIFPTAL
jgi:medium-chain acyl-[acyl-carrier-protein] hydrolase